MKNNVEFYTCNNDTKVDSVWIELEHRGDIKDHLQTLANFQKRFTNENCVYSSTIRNFKPVLAVFHSFVYGWDKGFKIRFFDESMLNNHQIESGFSDEPRNDKAIYHRTVYKIENGKISQVAYKLETK